ELPACLLAMGGEVDIASARGKRKVKADAFFKGLFETALRPNEIVTAVRIPVVDKNTRVGFAELARRHGDYAIVGLAASARTNGKGAPRGGAPLFGCRGHADPREESRGGARRWQR